MLESRPPEPLFEPPARFQRIRSIPKLVRTIGMLQRKPLATCHSEDAICVLAQLIASAEIRSRHLSEAHPHGSTVAREELTQTELVEPWVVIPLETDTIPVDIVGNWFGDGFACRVRFFHPQVRGGKITYDAQLI